MKKDRTIRHLLLLLVAQLGEGSFVIDESTPCDDRAIFLHHPRDPATRVYLYTVAQDEGRYGMHIEYPTTASAEAFLEMVDNQTLEAVVESLAVYFDISRVAPLPGR